MTKFDWFVVLGLPALAFAATAALCTGDPVTPGAYLRQMKAVCVPGSIRPVPVAPGILALGCDVK